MQIHQFYPTLADGDATSNQILNLQRLLCQLGYQGEIFCEQLPLGFAGHARQILEYNHHAAPENILFLHFSMGYSPQVLAWLAQIPDRKVLIYHNITPHTYFAKINNVYFEAAKLGREQLDYLREMVGRGWGDSHFNLRELAEQGWSQLDVLPIIFEPKFYDAIRPDRKVLKRWQNSINILFVGRVSPNKRFEDLILTFYYLKRFVQPEARLLLVGSTHKMEPYFEFLQALVNHLGLSDVVFTGHVSASQLVAYYRCASVYLSMSEHEGFGVPLLECMYFGVPTVAYKSAAVPETLGGSGILVTTKDYAAVAELVGLLVHDESLRRQIIDQQRKRLQDFLPESVAQQLQRLLQTFS